MEIVDRIVFVENVCLCGFEGEISMKGELSIEIVHEMASVGKQ